MNEGLPKAGNTPSSVAKVLQVTWPGLTPPYRTLVLDPPWPWKRTDRTKAQAARHYSSMTLADLRALPVGELADPTGAVLWLWAVNRFVGATYELARGWGFEPVTMLTWGKTGQPGVGRWLRNSTEHCVIAKMGHPPLPADPPDSLQMWPRAFTARTGSHGGGHFGHSVKPDAAFDLIERCSPGPRVELFQRRGRFGWDGWGWGYEMGESA